MTSTAVASTSRVAQADDKEQHKMMLKGQDLNALQVPKTTSKEKDQNSPVEASHTGNASVSLRNSILSVLIHSMSLFTEGVESIEERASLKVNGKKRVVDDDDEATATEGETSIAAASEPPLKKKKKQVK